MTCSFNHGSIKCDCWHWFACCSVVKRAPQCLCLVWIEKKQTNKKRANKQTKHQGLLHAFKQNVEHVFSSAPTSTSQVNITKQFSCLSYNIAYVIYCTKCAQLYIGETGRTLDTRFKEHLADFKHRRDKPVANHLTRLATLSSTFA